MADLSKEEQEQSVVSPDIEEALRQQGRDVERLLRRRRFTRSSEAADRCEHYQQLPQLQNLAHHATHACKTSAQSHDRPVCLAAPRTGMPTAASQMATTPPPPTAASRRTLSRQAQFPVDCTAERPRLDDSVRDQTHRHWHVTDMCMETLCSEARPPHCRRYVWRWSGGT